MKQTSCISNRSNTTMLLSKAIETEETVAPQAPQRAWHAQRIVQLLTPGVSALGIGKQSQRIRSLSKEGMFGVRSAPHKHRPKKACHFPVPKFQGCKPLEVLGRALTLEPPDLKRYSLPTH